MKYDKKLPAELKSIQTWFGGIIQQKMTDDFEICPLSPGGSPIDEESKKYIVETQDLTAAFRMQIYNQSYWMRLMDALQEEFPLVVRLFGHELFNREIAIPYLHWAPPRHWNLNHLGDRMAAWIDAFYQGKDRKLVLLSALIDRAYSELFLAKRNRPIDMTAVNSQQAELFLEAPIHLQATVRLFELPGHILDFRRKMLSQPVEYWETADFPPLAKDKTYYFIVYRTASHAIDWQELSLEEYLLLHLIDKKGTITAACDALEDMEQVDPEFVQENITSWIQKWILNRWLASVENTCDAFEKS